LNLKYALWNKIPIQRIKELFEGSKSKLPDSPYQNLKLDKPAQGPCNLFLGVYSICYVKVNGMTPNRKMGADAVGPQSCIQETLAGSIFISKRVELKTSKSYHFSYQPAVPFPEVACFCALFSIHAKLLQISHSCMSYSRNMSKAGSSTQVP
jgi:hypothetical protein